MYTVAIEGDTPGSASSTADEERRLVDALRQVLADPAAGVTSASFDSDDLGTVSLMPAPDLDTARARLAEAFSGISSSVKGYPDLAAAIADVDAAVERADLANATPAPAPGNAPQPAATPEGTAPPAADRPEHPEQTAAQTAPAAL